LPHWRALRRYAERSTAAGKGNRALQLTRAERKRLQGALAYIEKHCGQALLKEMSPWRAAILKLTADL
jgi:hypothetical protein